MCSTDMYLVETQSDGKSLFNASENIPNLIRQGESVVPTQQGGGNWQRIINAGRPVGVDRATGQATSTYTIITKPMVIWSLLFRGFHSHKVSLWGLSERLFTMRVGEKSRGGLTSHPLFFPS